MATAGSLRGGSNDAVHARPVRAGRDALIAEIAQAIGGNVLVVE
jgi:hypothetical protein